MARMKRKTGYYWIKNAAEWQVAKYDSVLNMWLFIGVDEWITENWIDEIDENIIEMPA